MAIVLWNMISAAAALSAPSTRRMAIAVVLLLTMTSVVQARDSGVQWSPDGKHIFVSKDLGGSRWAITLNLDDATVTGNFYSPSGGEPGFVWCERIAANSAPDLYSVQLQFRCFGANLDPSGAFSESDYQFISDSIVLPGWFFLPEPESCNLNDVTNGPNAGAPNSSWVCSTRERVEVLQFAAFANHTGVSSAIGPFTWVQTGCASGVLTDAHGVQSEFSALLSPSKGLLNVYEESPSGPGYTVLECHLAF